MKLYNKCPFCRIKMEKNEDLFNLYHKCPLCKFTQSIRKGTKWK